MSPQVESPGAVHLNRRTMLKTLGTAAGVAAVGGTSGELGLEPVGKSDALGVTAGIIIGGAAAAAGVAVAKWADGDPEEPDTSGSDVLTDSIYNAGLTVSEGRSVFEEQMVNDYLNRSDNTTPYAKTAWSEIRATVAKAAVNGESTTTAEQNANDALAHVTRRSVRNIAERWNTGISALSSHLLEQSKDSNVEVIYGNDSGSPYSIIYNDPANLGADFSGVDGFGNGSGSYLIQKGTLSGLPGNPGDFDDLPDSDPELWGLTTDNGNDWWLGPSGSWGLVPSGGTFNNYLIEVRHPNYETTTVLHNSNYADVLSKIESEYNSIQSDLSTYTSNLMSAIDQGVIDPSDIYSPSDLTEQFASSPERERVAAELAAIGVEVPDDVSFEAQISHPGLAADDLWVDLYVSWVDGSAKTISAGMTITSSEYRVAYIGYTSQADGSYVTETLSGGSDLQILDVSGTSTDADVTESTTLESDGSINLGSNPPDPVQNPGDYDVSHTLVIETETSGTFTAPVSDVTESGGDYILPATNSPLSGGETVLSVRVVKDAAQQQSSPYVADPTTVDSQQVQDLLESQSDLVDKIEKLEEAAATGGGGNGVGIWSWMPDNARIAWAESNIPGGTETAAAGGSLGILAWLS